MHLSHGTIHIIVAILLPTVGIGITALMRHRQGLNYHAGGDIIMLFMLFDFTIAAQLYDISAHIRVDIAKNYTTAAFALGVVIGLAFLWLTFWLEAVSHRLAAWRQRVVQWISYSPSVFATSMHIQILSAFSEW